MGIHQAMMMPAVPPAAILLLDLLSVNAKAAYSTRKIKNSYSGPALRVRRSSDNAEQDIGFANGELDNAALLAFCGAGSGFVRTLYDQTGNGKDAVQTNTSIQPRIVLNGALWAFNGKTSPSYVTNMCLIGNPSFTGPTGTFLAVGQCANGSNYMRLAAIGTAGTVDYNNDGNWMPFVQSATSASFSSARNAAGTSVVAVTYGTPFNIATMSNGTTLALYFNGVAAATTGSISTNLVVNSIYLGSDLQSATNWNGFIAEVILFDVALGTGDRATAYANQRTYWGTA